MLVGKDPFDCWFWEARISFNCLIFSPNSLHLLEAFCNSSSRILSVSLEKNTLRSFWQPPKMTRNYGFPTITESRYFGNK